jgi:formylglycine-generating enzyme required for sulfatase activity/serine/threonine protein kinase
VSISLEQFFQQLTQSGLLSETEVSNFQQSLPAQQRPTDAEGLARELVQAKRLTRYQAAAVAQGKAKSLVFDEYVILDKLGQGGMGVVLKAEHRRMKRQVAIKIIAPAAVKSPDAVRRFYREVEAAARLSHPNIVAAHDAREYHGSHCLVMEYIEGRDLAAIVKQHGPLPVRQAVECILQAARGLEFAHKRGVVHRDIKPANLLLDREGTVKILDMGLARVAGIGEDAEGERLTQSGQVMGTCDYMAPEQSLDTHKADHRADIYSLGCTLYRLLTNNTPYKGETYAKLFMAHLNDPIPSIRDTRPDVPADVDAVFARMVAKQAEDRQQSMTELISELEACLGKRASQAGDDESLSNGALAFLREITEGGTATRQRVQSRVEETMAPEAHPETGTNLGLAPATAGRKRLLTGLALAGAAVVAFCGVIVTLRHGSGKQTTIQVPDGSRVAIRGDGQVDVTPPAGASSVSSAAVSAPGSAGGSSDAEMQRYEKRWGIKRHEDAPGIRAGGGFDPKLAGKGTANRLQVTGDRLQGTAASASPFVGPDGNWQLPPGAPPPAIAPFDVQKAREHQEAWAKYLGIPVEVTNSIGMKFVLIPPGEFQMGSTPEEIGWAQDATQKLDPARTKEAEGLSREQPKHRVRISRPFYLGKFEVTQAEYQQVTGVNPSEFSPQGGRRNAVGGLDTRRLPVEMILWDDAQAFCERLGASRQADLPIQRYVLPTEAQWEYACRAGTAGQWSFVAEYKSNSDEDQKAVGEYAWVQGNSEAITHAVGEKKPNAWGLHDMHGNVIEWCADLGSHGYYQRSPLLDPQGPDMGTAHIVRGGAFNNPSTMTRSGWRGTPSEGARFPHFGMRVAGEIDLSKTLAGKARPVAGTPVSRQGPGLTGPSPCIAPDGNWQLPPGAPPPAIAPFDEKQAREHQEAWAKYLQLPLEMANSVGMQFILIPPGEFEMGSTPEEIAAMIKADVNYKFAESRQRLIRSTGPKHRVRITRPLYMSRYEVTQAVYQRATGNNPSSFSDQNQAPPADDASFSEAIRSERVNDRQRVAGKDTGQQPVESVSWEHAAQFARTLGELAAERSAKREYRLPTEAEWEYACRAGTPGLWPCGTEDRLAEIAWCALPKILPHTVGTKKPNAWGLFDVVGNVFEWCSDWFSYDYYAASPIADPPGPSTGERHLVRGGAWLTESYLSHSTFRLSFGQGGHQIGFRLVCPIAIPPQ